MSVSTPLFCTFVSGRVDREDKLILHNMPGEKLCSTIFCFLVGGCLTCHTLLKGISSHQRILTTREGMSHLKEAECIAFQKWSPKTDYFLSLTSCQGLDTVNVWMEPGLQITSCLEPPMAYNRIASLTFVQFFIASCKLLTVLICLVIDMPRLNCDRMFRLIEIMNVLLDLLKNNEKATIIGYQTLEYIS